eukprot:jgi/Psemu1/4795/gm1.4795_g
MASSSSLPPWKERSRYLDLKILCATKAWKLQDTLGFIFDLATECDIRCQSATLTHMMTNTVIMLIKSIMRKRGVEFGMSNWLRMSQGIAEARLLVNEPNIQVNVIGSENDESNANNTGMLSSSLESDQSLEAVINCDCDYDYYYRANGNGNGNGNDANDTDDKTKKMGMALRPCLTCGYNNMERVMGMSTFGTAVIKAVLTEHKSETNTIIPCVSEEKVMQKNQVHGCADGPTQQDFILKENASYSLTVSLHHALMPTYLINTIEGRDVTTADIPGAF